MTQRKATTVELDPYFSLTPLRWYTVVMVTPAFYNIDIQKRVTFRRVIQLKGSDGAPLNLTGYTVTAEAWNHDRTKKMFDFTTTWVDRTSGKFVISLTDAQTADLSSKGVWDLMVTNPDGTKDYWLRGDMRLVP